MIDFFTKKKNQKNGMFFRFIYISLIETYYEAIGSFIISLYVVADPNIIHESGTNATRFEF